MTTNILSLKEDEVPPQLIKLTKSTLHQFDGKEIDLVISVLLTSVVQVVEELPDEVRMQVSDSLFKLASNITDEVRQGKEATRQ